MKEEALEAQEAQEEEALQETEAETMWEEAL